jgi:transcriptional regulator with XRE-family HTH domain
MRGEGIRRNPAKPEDLRILAAAITAALAYAGLTRQEAAHVLGYADETTVTRWAKGSDPNPNVAKLWTLGARFRQGLIIALAASCESGVRVHTVVELVNDRLSA